MCYRMTFICGSLMLVFSESYKYEVYILMYIYLCMWAIWYAVRTYIHIYLCRRVLIYQCTYAMLLVCCTV